MVICNFGFKLIDEVKEKFIEFGLVFKDLVLGFDLFVVVEVYDEVNDDDYVEIE